jgi:GDSL-like lipase/acylhydrolase family protein
MRKLTLYGIFILMMFIPPGGAAAQVAPAAYTALGDSYSAGEGNHPFDGSCHRATRTDSAFPRILPTLLDYVGSPNFHACTGAVTADVMQRPQPGKRGQAIQTDYVRDSDMLVTLTIGGNDLHFSSILRECLLRLNCAKSSLARRVEAELTTIGPKLVNVYTRIRNEMNPRGYLLVAGYPHLFELGAKAGCNPLVSPDESTWVDRLVDRGNAKIATAVRTAGGAGSNVFYVSAVSRFKGHELCADDPWLYGLRLSIHEGLNLFQGSYHPTRAGQLAYAMAFADFLSRPGVRSALTACGSPQNAC